VKEIMLVPREKIITVVSAVVIISCAALTEVLAQTPSPNVNANNAGVWRGKLRRGRHRTHRSPTTTTTRQVATTTTPTQRSLPVVVEPRPSAPPAYLFGQAQVAVRGNEDPVVRLGLAQHGPTVVEFPASDNFYAVHPGGSSIVTYDESPTLATDHYLVFRAGSGFLNGVSDANGGEARASVSVQMQSGLFVTFLFYPVRDVAQMAHRCVITYSREDVVTARRAAGLAVNLDGRTPPQATPAPVSRRVTGVDNAASPGERTAEDQTATATREHQSVGITLESGELVNNAPSARTTNANPRRRTADFRREAQRGLREALAAPDKFNRWSAPVHGLAIAATAPVDIDDRRRLTVVAVRNSTQRGLRLMPNAPDLDLLTMNEAGQPVQVRSINRLHTETSGAGGALPAGATIYYAIIYEAQVLDSAQRVRLSVAQMSAADQPASTELTSAN